MAVARQSISSSQNARKLRSGSLDMLRAAAILLFIFYHVLVTAVPEASIPFFLRYNQGPFLLFGDLVAPAFSFIVGAALFFSYSNSQGKGRGFFKRKAISFTGILLLGILLDGISCGSANWQCVKWGVLQWLGAGGLMALFFVRFPLALRLGAFMLLISAYFARDSIIFAFPLQWSGFSYAASTTWQYGIISIFGTIAAEFYSKRKLQLAALSFAVLLAGRYLSQAFPIDKVQGSPTFVIVSCAFPALVWLLLSRFDRGIPRIVSFISQNSLLLWVLQYVLMWWPMSLLGLWGKVSLSFQEGLLLSILALPIFVMAAQYLVYGVSPSWKKLLENKPFAREGPAFKAKPM